MVHDVYIHVYLPYSGAVVMAGGCDICAGTQLKFEGYLGEETVSFGFQKMVGCVINLTSRLLVFLFLLSLTRSWPS